jgi:hypothetical protein
MRERVLEAKGGVYSRIHMALSLCISLCAHYTVTQWYSNRLRAVKSFFVPVIITRIILCGVRGGVGDDGRCSEGGMDQLRRL